MRDKHSEDAPPRIAPLEVDELTDDLMAIMAPMMAVNEALDSRDVGMLTDVLETDASAPDHRAALANLPEIMRTMLRHPGLFSSLTQRGVQLLGRGVLPARDRELAVLHTGWLCQAPYEFGEHVLIAKKRASPPKMSNASHKVPRHPAGASTNKRSCELSKNCIKAQ